MTMAWKLPKNPNGPDGIFVTVAGVADVAESLLAIPFDKNLRLGHLLRVVFLKVCHLELFTETL